MKRIILFLLIFSAFKVDAQITTRKLLGFNPINGQPYIYFDTLRTIYYQDPLYADHDTVKTTGGSGGGQWTLIGDNITNSNTGKVGINADTPVAQLEVVTPTNTTQLIDSGGITLSTPFAATNTQYKSPGTVVFKNQGYNTTTGASQTETFRIGTFGRSGAGGAYPDVYFQASKDGVTYANIFHTSGQTTIFDGAIQGTGATFSQALTAAGLNSNGNNMYNTNGSAQTVIGKSPAGWPSEPAAIVAFYSNGKQGLLPPVMTMAQRDSFGYTVSAVTMTNGGTGYTSAPNVTGNQTYLNSSAPSVNGVQDWGGNYFAGTATISGGAVTGVTITHGGYFNGAVKINFAGGGGTGATATATMSRLLPDGLIIYCSNCTATDGSTGVNQTWQNSTSTWKNWW